MNKKKIIVLLVLCIAVIGFSMSSVAAADTATKTVSTKSYTYKNVQIGRHDAGVEKMKQRYGQFNHLVRITDYDMRIYKLKFYYKYKGKKYTKTYRMPKKFFNMRGDKYTYIYKVKIYYYKAGHK